MFVCGIVLSHALPRTVLAMRSRRNKRAAGHDEHHARELSKTPALYWPFADFTQDIRGTAMWAGLGRLEKRLAPNGDR